MASPRGLKRSGSVSVLPPAKRTSSKAIDDVDMKQCGVQHLANEEISVSVLPAVELDVDADVDTPFRKLRDIFPVATTEDLKAVLTVFGDDLSGAAEALMGSGGKEVAPTRTTAQGDLDTATLSLKLAFPKASDDRVRDVLKRTGSLSKAAATLEGGAPEPTLDFTYPDALKRVQSVFPDFDTPRLEAALVACEGNVDSAVDALFAKPSRFDLDDDSGAALGGARKPARKKRTIGRLPKTLPKGGGARGSQDLPFHCDRTKDCQSFRSLLPQEEPMTLVHNAVGRDLDIGTMAAYCFQSMLEREQELNDSHVVFYHSYSAAALLYEVQAEIARCLYNLPSDLAPLPRLMKAPFDGKPTLDMLLEDFSGMTGQDHDPAFRALAISVTNSLFGFGSEAPPLTCFRTGYSCTDLSFRGLMETLLKDCGVAKTMVAPMADALADLADEYNMTGACYRKTPRGGGFGLGVPMTGTSMFGHMLQIFVKKDVVDDLAYRSQPMGIRIADADPISKYLEGNSTGPGRKVEGQARLFMHPACFTDPDKATVFHYCASPKLMSPDASCHGSRGEFLLKLRKILDPIVGSYDGLKRAYRGVEAIGS